MSTNWSYAIIRTDPDEKKTFAELISSHGYVLQEHNVTTHDGYILTVHRVVPPDFDPQYYNLFRKPVVAFHGVLTDSSIFFINSPHIQSNDSHCADNFGFCILQTERYDLWLPNARGNGFSDRHVKYSKYDKRFWKFSWEEIAFYDVPAFVDYIRSVTGHRTLGYVGYSQGGGTMFALMSLRPEYTKIIQPFITWAPGVFLGNTRSLVKIFTPLIPILHKISCPFIVSKSYVNVLLQILCRPPLGNIICSKLILQASFGKSVSINKTSVATYLHYIPRPSSNFQLAHYGQMYQSNRFAAFDYGSKKNWKVYGQRFPPEFPLWNIPSNLNVIVMYGQTDGLIGPRDAQKLISILQSVGVNVVDYQVPTPIWSHTDFVTGTGAGRLVYDETIRYLDIYSWDSFL